MKYKAVILPAAKEDLREAAKWYNQCSTGLGKQLLKRFRERMNELRIIHLLVKFGILKFIRLW